MGFSSSSLGICLFKGARCHFGAKTGVAVTFKLLQSVEDGVASLVKLDVRRLTQACYEETCMTLLDYIFVHAKNLFGSHTEAF